MEPMEDASTVERMLMQRAKGSQIPINGSIELLPLCNMSCDMCYVRMSRAEMESKGRLRTAEEWLDLGRQMQQAGVLFLLLTGGEPLLYPDFKEVYLGLKKLGMILTINTNGTLIDEAWADFFAANKPRRMNITLYGPDAETYDTLCHYKSGFEKTMEAVRLLRERGVDVRLSVSVAKANAGQVEKIVACGNRLEVPTIVDAYMMPAVRERSLPYPMQARMGPEEAAKVGVASAKLTKTPEEYAAFVKGMVYKAEHYEPDPKMAKINCYAGSCSFAVNWQGQLRPCVILSQPSVSVFDCGFAEAWKQLRAACDEIRVSPKCVSCRLRLICHTCAAAALLETGSYDGVSDYLCCFAEESYRLLKQEEENLGEAF